MVRAAVSALLVLAGVGVTSSGAGGPAAALQQAFQKTSGAASENLSLTEHIRAAGRTLSTIRLSGIEQPKAGAGSFVFSSTPSQAGPGRASEIIHGSKVYVHFDVLDQLRAKNPRVKSWIVLDSKSSLGVNPTSFTGLTTKEVQALTGVRVLGGGTVGGVQVTRYAGTLALRRVATAPQVQQFLAHLPSAAGAILRGKEHLVVAVGTDGYVHGITASIQVPFSGQQLDIDVDATLGNFGGSTGAIIPPAASEVMTVAQFDRILGLPSPGDTALLDKVVLRPAQVGARYKESQIPGGQLVRGERTLDFCEKTYPSESLRTARLQVEYTKAGAAFKASNEVVTYKPGGARQALGEVAHAVATCPNGTVKTTVRGVKRLVRHTRVLHDPRLLPGAVAVLEVDSAVVNGKRVTQNTVAVYQVRGNVLSGVYGLGSSVAAAEADTFRLAEHSAANLKRYVRATTS